MASKEVTKFVKKHNIIQEYVSIGGGLPVASIEELLQKFKDEENKRIIRLINKDSSMNYSQATRL